MQFYLASYVLDIHKVARVTGEADDNFVSIESDNRTLCWH